MRTVDFDRQDPSVREPELRIQVSTSTVAPASHSLSCWQRESVLATDATEVDLAQRLRPLLDIPECKQERLPMFGA